MKSPYSISLQKENNIINCVVIDYYRLTKLINLTIFLYNADLLSYFIQALYPYIISLYQTYYPLVNISKCIAGYFDGLTTCSCQYNRFYQRKIIFQKTQDGIHMREL
jgi:hypothetical protein